MKVIVSVAVCPSQTEVVPLKTAVGRSFTVTIALPLISPGIALHLVSFIDVRVYVFVEVGDTVNV